MDNKSAYWCDKYHEASAQLAEYKQRAEAAEDQLTAISNIMHYPDCWDTAAHPTLEHAVVEAYCCSECYKE